MYAPLQFISLNPDAGHELPIGNTIGRAKEELFVK